MKLFDQFLRSWRVRVALKYIPEGANCFFDIGCDDGFLLKKIQAKNFQLDGCDPRLNIKPIGGYSKLCKGFFPAVMNEEHLKQTYDAIFSLAVFEHFTDADLKDTAKTVRKMLKPNGRLIVTVPHPFVDKIIDILQFLRIMDGTAIEEHHEFDPNSLPELFSESLKCTAHKNFQLGLNNLFVFERL